MYLIHAGLNTVAVVLLTVGVYFAIKKPQNWFPKHRALMLSGAVVLTISVFYALWLKEYNMSAKKESSLHSHIGAVLFILLFIQVFIAVTHRKELGPKYLFIHKTGAMLIFGLLIFQVYLGIKEYTSRKNNI